MGLLSFFGTGEGSEELRAFLGPVASRANSGLDRSSILELGVGFGLLGSGFWDLHRGQEPR